MKKFIKVFVCYILILCAIVLVVNNFYVKLSRKEDGYSNNFKNIPNKIEICNFGSSHGLYGYNYEDIENTYSCFNFALVSQTLSYDYRLLDYYQEKLQKGTIVFITISYFSLYGQDETLGEDFESKNKRYYEILPRKYIKEYDVMTDLFVKLPSLAAYEDLIYTFLGRRNIAENEDWWNMKAYDIEDIKVRAEEAYQRHVMVNINENEEFDKNEKELEAIYQMISICQEQGAVPILVTTPYLKEYTDAVKKGTPEFLPVFYDDIQKIIEDTNVTYCDYAMDERFWLDYSLFRDPDHLNREGAKKFVNILLDEVCNGLVPCS